MRKSWSNRSFILPDIDPSVAVVQALHSEAKHRAVFRQEREIDVPSAATPSNGARRIVTAIRGRTLTPVAVIFMLLLGMTSAWSQAVTCKPLLSATVVREVRPAFPQVRPWRWYATIAADARFCTTRSGNFEMDFVRVKDDAPDLQFSQAFRWTPGPFEISMELGPGEAILESRIGFIAPCACRQPGQFSVNARTK
jgi:hypothetical protein